MLKILIFLSIFSLSFASNLFCHFELDEESGNYYCYGTTSTPTGSDTITSVTGDHVPGLGNSDVDVIYFYGQEELIYIPRGLSSFFPSTIGIAVYGCPISTIRGDELTGFARLQRFGIVGAHVNRIPGNLFDNNPEIESVTFYSSGILHVGFDLLSHLQFLNNANFEENLCIDQSAWNRAEVLDLIGNLRASCPDI